METLEGILAKHPFFTGLDQYAELLTGCASNVRFDAGVYLFKEGEEANEFYLIRSGRVALEVFAPQRKPVTLATMSEGEIMGWSWLVPPYQQRFHGRAVVPVRAIALNGKCLRVKCEENHDLGYEMLKRFAGIMEQRLESTLFQLLDVYAVGR